MVELETVAVTVHHVLTVGSPDVFSHVPWGLQLLGFTKE